MTISDKMEGTRCITTTQDHIEADGHLMIDMPANVEQNANDIGDSQFFWTDMSEKGPSYYKIRHQRSC